jgi:hypothetical protein
MPWWVSDRVARRDRAAVADATHLALSRRSPKHPLQDGTPMPFPTHESLSSSLRFGPAGVPGGALTARGVDHMVSVGRAMRRRYVDETGLLPPGFAPSAVYLRCVTGAAVGG